VGICFGAIVDYTEPTLFPDYSPDLFFHWLLPPIILEAAYSLYHPAFSNNIATILLFAVVVSYLEKNWGGGWWSHWSVMM
jgi:hypothetical protein